MILITFLPHTPFKKKNVLTFLISTVVSMGKRKSEFPIIDVTKVKKNSSNCESNPCPNSISFYERMTKAIYIAPPTIFS